MLSEEEKKRACNATLDDFIEKVKDMPVYMSYVDAVKNGKKNTAERLQLSVMMHSMMDDVFALMMNSVAMDLLFFMIDQRLRSEILEGK